MRKRILTASAVIVVLFGVAFAVRSFVFESSAVGGDAGVPIVDAGVTEAELDAAADVDEGPREAVVVDVQGRVLRQGESGERVEVRVGETVPLDSVLETEDGAAILNVAEATTVELESQTAVTLTASEDGVAGVRLDRGRTVAHAEGSSAGVRVTFADSDAVAETRDGDIAAVTDGTGRVTVASNRGSVNLSAQGESVEIQEGEESSVQPESAPTTPRSVPGSFFLRVRRPPGQSRIAATTIQGEATPGSVVNVDGTPAAVDENGRFRARVALREGRNRVTVHGRDASGRSQSRSHTVVVDSSASGIESDVAWQ